MTTGEGTRVKKVLAAILLAIGGMMAGTGAMAQVQMDVYFTANAMERETAERLMELTRRAFPQAQWNCRQAEDEESDLRALILADDVPEIVVCAPGEANLWVSDGLFAALDGRVTDADRIDEQVLGACVQDESLFMLPLVARHRQMAVNRRLMEKRRLDSMTNPIEHPLWYPMEFDQILEEFALADHPALEIWPAEPENSGALEAMLQALYGGAWLDEKGECAQAEHVNVRAALEWLQDRVKGGLIARAESRDEALTNFLNGETAIFMDWQSAYSRLYARELEKNGVEIVEMPYPSSTGFVIRSFELTGACVAAGTDNAKRELAMRAIAFWHEDAQTQMALGDRGIWQDDAVWLPEIDATQKGMTLRRLMCEAVEAVLGGECAPKDALRLVQAAMEAM